MDKYSDQIIERAKKIKLVAVDVDGVLTDGKLFYNSRGEEFKNFDVKDGLGMILLRYVGFTTVIVTARASKLVIKRAKELKINKVYQNFHDKIHALDKIQKKFKVKKEQICFIGDDIIDVPILKRVGLAVCPFNAIKEVKDFVHFVSDKNGGCGVIREICDLILKAQNKWGKIEKRYFS